MTVTEIPEMNHIKPCPVGIQSSQGNRGAEEGTPCCVGGMYSANEHKRKTSVDLSLWKVWFGWALVVVD